MTDLPIDLVEDVPDEIADRRLSVRVVWMVLEYESELSRSDLEGRTGLSEDTVRRALNDLERAGLVERERDPEDPRADRCTIQREDQQDR